jgi:hypothetical protein
MGCDRTEWDGTGWDWAIATRGRVQLVRNVSFVLTIYLCVASVYDSKQAQGEYDCPTLCTELNHSFIWYAGCYMFRRPYAILSEFPMSSWVTWKQKWLLFVIYCECWWPVCTGCCSVYYVVQLSAILGFSYSSVWEWNMGYSWDGFENTEYRGEGNIERDTWIGVQRGMGWVRTDESMSVLSSIYGNVLERMDQRKRVQGMYESKPGWSRIMGRPGLRWLGDMEKVIREMDVT